MLPILFPVSSANQIFPSGPAVIPRGVELAVGMVNSVMAPVVVILPILLVFCSVNHRFPSAPVAMSSRLLEAVGTLKLVNGI